MLYFVGHIYGEGNIKNYKFRVFIINDYAFNKCKTFQFTCYVLFCLHKTASYG